MLRQNRGRACRPESPYSVGAARDRAAFMFSFGINDFQSAYGRFSTARGGFGSLPGPARFIVGLAALPGIVLAALSLLLFIVSILALLLLTVPVYRILQAVTGNRPAAATVAPTGSLFDPEPSPGRKQVDVRVVD